MEPNAGRDYISCHDKRSRWFVCRFLENLAGECRREYMARAKSAKQVRVLWLDPNKVRQSLVKLLSPVQRRLRRMQEELHVICRFPVRIRVVPFAGTIAQLDRATDCFSTDRRRRLGPKCVIISAANADGLHGFPVRIRAAPPAVGAVAQWVEQGSFTDCRR
jgi:hypothetical protein